MTINEIMKRDLEAEWREAEEAHNKAKNERRGRIATAFKAIVWAALILAIAAAAFAAGYAKCAKDDLERDAEQEREWAEQDSNAEATARAMLNWELLHNGDKVATNKTGETR